MSDTGTGNDGPVFHGEVKDAQFAWGNNTVTQHQSHSEQVAPGFEEVARAVAQVLQALPELGLPAQDSQQAKENADAVLAEVVHPEPDPGVVRRGLTAIKGTLSQLAAGLLTGAATGSAEVGRELVKTLSQLNF